MKIDLKAGVPIRHVSMAVQWGEKVQTELRLVGDEEGAAGFATHLNRGKKTHAQRFNGV
ncbi:MAG: hypothetical protein V4532_04210 [Pseudomonadota bacterium]